MVTLAGIQAVGSILGPVMLALVLVGGVSGQGFLERRGSPQWAQVAVPFLIVLLVLAGMLAIIAVAATQLAQIAPAYTDKFAALAAEARAFAAGGGARDRADRQGGGVVRPQPVAADRAGLLMGALGAGSALYLIVILSLSMSLDAPAFTRIIRVAKVERPEMHSALTTSGADARYLWVSTVFGIICAVLDVIALFVFSVPLPLLWGSWR